jgi:hypothetical protein
MPTTQPTTVHNGAKPMDTPVPTVPAVPGGVGMVRVGRLPK